MNNVLFRFRRRYINIKVVLNSKFLQAFKSNGSPCIQLINRRCTGYQSKNRCKLYSLLLTRRKNVVDGATLYMIGRYRSFLSLIKVK